MYTFLNSAFINLVVMYQKKKLLQSYDFFSLFFRVLIIVVSIYNIYIHVIYFSSVNMKDWLVIVIDVVAIFSINNVVFVFIFSTHTWTKICGFPTLHDLKIDSLYEMWPCLLAIVFTWEVPSRWWVLFILWVLQM